MSLILFPSAEGVPSKTYQYDDSIVLESGSRQWLTKALEVELRMMKRGELFVNLSWHRLREASMAAVLAAGLEIWGVTPHTLRHAGPSNDYVQKYRSLLDTQRRGRWSAVASVRRYEQASQVNARLLTVPESTVLFIEKADRELPALLAASRPASPDLRTLLGRVGRR